MTKISKEKLNEIRQSAGLSYQEIADKCNLSMSAVSKIFGGFRSNPTLELLVELAKALNCSIDDFVDWEDEKPLPYYHERETAELAQLLSERPYLKAVLRGMRDMPQNDAAIIQEIIDRMKK